MLNRFRCHITKQGDCWLFGNNPSRYASFFRRKIDGGAIGAHVFSYLIHHGPIPEGQLVRHKCDTKHCVNPDHLIAGTQAENVRDMIERNRFSRPNAKLTPKDVEEIRKRYDRREATQSEMARQYGVAPGTIWHAVHGLNWKQVASDKLELNALNNSHGT
ncbi:MAG TPA: HNH endonuclease [Blastocatellia bacterium]|nr:HNH endonuclease [Blastocatellia bacterium]HMV87230.1 HNH endonuclease [Blastocatellia bacterium]HMZ22386.1 HNH endonuclease [Blastocatellia bacterium]HNG34063.1 HNH endonuclease [Blastocatellia bacterium]